LAVSVFSCPLICHSGHVASRPDGKPIASCCCHPITTTNPLGDGSNHVPNRLPGSGGCCRGICGGAVFQQSIAFDVALDTNWSLPVAMMEPVLLTNLQEMQFNRSCTTPWPDDEANRGRVLCCLFSTLLC